EPRRVQPSKRKAGGEDAPPKEGFVPPPAPGKSAGPTGRRRTTKPLIEIARAEQQPEALEGLERWKAKHPGAAAALPPTDVLVDIIRARSAVRWRIRVNLEHVPEAERPEQEALEIDYAPWEGFTGPRPPRNG